MRILKRSAIAVLLLVITAGLLVSPVWAEDGHNSPGIHKAVSSHDDDDHGRSDNDNSQSDNDHSQSDNNHSQGDNDDYRQGRSSTWTLDLNGAIDTTLTTSAFESGVADGYKASWTDAQGNTYTGMPLWRLIAMIDDKNPTGSGSFNDGLATIGYSIIVSGDSATPAKLDSCTVARNPGYIIANRMNGKAIQYGGDTTPLVLVGGNIPSTMRVNGVDDITLVFKSGTTPPVPVATGQLAVSSIPTGAVIALDGTAKGTTPATLAGIATGTHSVVLTLSGFQDLTQSVTVASNQTATVNATLVPAPVTTGSINLTSSPSGASVTVDGTAKGITPTVLTGIAAGSHQVVFSYAGYSNFTQTVTVASGQTTNAFCSLLTAPPGTGSIAVSSTPSGAGVTVDGVAKGTTTPATIAGIAPGAHSVIFSLAGYQSLTQSVTVTAGQTATASGTLTALSTTGLIAVSSTPSGAGVTVDGVAKGTTPATIAGIAPGVHSVIFSLAGYSSLTQSVTVTAGQTATTSGTLVALPTTGSIAVSSTPSGAGVTVDGVAKGTTPATITGIALGAHSVVFSLAGYQSLTQSVTVTAGQTATASGTLVTVPPAVGSISVVSTPSGASVTLDGVAHGKTPATLTGITPGAHQLAVTLSGYQVSTQSVTVTVSQTSAVNVVLLPIITPTPTPTPIPTPTIPPVTLGPIALQGVQSVTVTASRVSQGTMMHHYDYTDSTGTVWGGIPLWYLVGFMDDTTGSPTGSHGSSTFNAAKAASGYTVTVTGKTGSSAGFTSQSMAKSNSYLVANTKNGVPIPSTDPQGPYKLVGTGVTGAQSIDGIVTIRMA